MAKQAFREFVDVRRRADRPLQPMNRRELVRAIAREPVLPRDPTQRAAQADRIRKLMEGQPLHVRQLARRLLKEHWDRASRVKYPRRP